MEVNIAQNSTIPDEIDGVTIPFPYPLDFWTLMATVAGAMFGRAVGKKLDFEIQDTDWFKKQGFWTQQIIKRLLDVLHHWWIGVIIMYATAVQAEFLTTVLRFPESLLPLAFYFGFGMFLDDVRDVKHILERLKIEQDEAETPPVTPPPVVP